VGNLISHAQPFVKPNVDRGLIAAGRDTDLDSDSREFLTRVEWQTFDAMMLPESRFLTSTSRIALELMLFGSGVQWTGRKRGLRPEVHDPAAARLLVQRERGRRRRHPVLQFTLPLWKAVARWPDHGIAKWTATWPTRPRSAAW
jgi:hypothetical protein